MRTCRCPSCDANISIDDENRDFAFCQYCGSKVMLDDYRSTHRVIDEAKIRQAEIEREIRLKELSIKEAQISQRNQIRKVLTYIWIGSIFAVALLCIVVWISGGETGGLTAFCCLFYVGGPVVGGGGYLIFKVIPEKESEKEAIQNGGIRFPKNLGNLSEQNFIDIQQKLISAGFQNIVCVNMHDVTLGIIQKPGMVESVTVNGEKITSGGKVYKPDVPIVITYHGR